VIEIGCYSRLAMLENRNLENSHWEFECEDPTT
jgi:hypothetical protein